MPARHIPSPVYQLKITLLGTAPPIWRRLQVPSTIKLCCLHTAFQVAMGWTDSHVHEFEQDGKHWGVPEHDEFGEGDLIDEGRSRIGSVLKAPGDSLTYVYDLGDGWRHEVVLEEIVPPGDCTGPLCLAGERHCPPEDVGGPHGYQEFLEVIFQPGHEEFEHYRRWAGDSFQPEEFNPKAVNEALSKMRFPVRHRR